MPHNHHHVNTSEVGERRLLWAIAVNMLLTLVQVFGGLISGSLSLVADALHNFSDAASLLIAVIAIRIGRKPPDRFKTFGYKRAGIIAALINLTTLILIGIYLCYEAIARFINPEPIEGWTVVYIAVFALIIDVITALLTYSQSKHSLNIKSAFLHNLSDALASVGVIIAGTLILMHNWIWTDAAVTLIIAGYVLWQGFTTITKVIHILMEGTPEGLSIDGIVSTMETVDGVRTVHHVHVWQLDEIYNALEAHVLINNEAEIDQIKSALKSMLLDRFKILHSTLELEYKKSELDNNECH